jgi:hypothetical protein
MGSIPVLANMYILSVKIVSHMHVNCQWCHIIKLSALLKLLSWESVRLKI